MYMYMSMYMGPEKGDLLLFQYYFVVKPANNFCQLAGHLSGQEQVLTVRLTKSQFSRTKCVFPSPVYANWYYGPAIKLKHFIFAHKLQVT